MYSLVDRNPRFPSERPYSHRRPSRHTSIVSAPVQAEHLVSLVHKSPTARTAISLAYVLHFTRPNITTAENWAVLCRIRNRRRCYTYKRDATCMIHLTGERRWESGKIVSALWDFIANIIYLIRRAMQKRESKDRLWSIILIRFYFFTTSRITKRRKVELVLKFWTPER